MNERRDASFVSALILGVLGGLLVGGPSAWFIARRTAERGSWSVVPFVGAQVSVDAGTRLDFLVLSQFSMPEPFFNTSMVRFESGRRFVGRATSVPLEPGAPLSWSLISPTDPTCLDELTDLLADAGVDAPSDSKQVIEGLKARLAHSPD